MYRRSPVRVRAPISTSWWRSRVAVARDGGSDRNVVFSAEPTFEAGNTLPKHVFDNLLLAFIKPPAKSIVEFRLVNEEGYPFERCLSGLQDCLRKIDDSSGDIEHRLVTFKLRIISLSVSLDRKCKRDQARLPDILSQGPLTTRHSCCVAPSCGA